MSLSHSPKIPTNNLVFYIDAASEKSYPGSGITVKNLMSSTTYPDVSLQYDYATYGSIADGVVNISGAEGSVSTAGTFLRGFGNMGSTINANFTTIGWLNRNSSARGTIMDYRGSSRRCEFYATNSSIGFNERIETLVDGGYPTYSTLVSQSSNLNQWYCYALRRDGTNFSFYQNGELIGTTSYTMKETISGGTFSIGIAWPDDDYASQGMNGSIGPVMQYTAALSDEEIKQIYTATRGRFI